MGIGPPKGGQGRTRYIASSVCLYVCAPVVVVVGFFVFVVFVVVFMRPHPKLTTQTTVC